MALSKARQLKKTTLRLYEWLLPNMYLGCFWSIVPVEKETEKVWGELEALQEEIPGFIFKKYDNLVFLWLSDLAEGISQIQKIAPRWFTPAHEKAALRQRIVNISNAGYLLNKGHFSLNVFDVSYADAELGELEGVRIPLDLYSLVDILKRTNLGVLTTEGVLDPLNVSFQDISSLLLTSPFWAEDNTLRVELARIF